MIQVEQLRRHYGPVVALDGISFRVEPGEVLGFLGPNGAGKTTTMKILTGFLAPTAGRAFVAGKPVDGPRADFRRHLGYLPESAPLHPELTVEEHLLFAGRARGMGRARLRARLAAVAEQCGLGPVRGREVRQLSKGYRQRVGLAQAILDEPDLLILDEPTSGLDPNQVVEMRSLVRSLGAARTVLFSSHVLQEVQAVATRVLILDRGRIVADGTPAELGARVTGGSLRLRVRGADAVTVQRRLASLEGVQRATADGVGEVEVRVQPCDGREIRPQVARAVVEAGWDLLALDLDRADLEAVFRHLTREAA